MNAKKHGVPQNRERIFIIGIRDDQDNHFRWPKEEHLTKKLKNILEVEVLQKFYLSERAIAKCKRSQANKDIEIKEVSDVSKCIVAGYYKIPFDSQYINFSVANSETRRGRVGKDVAQTLDTQCNQGIIIDSTNSFKEDQKRIYHNCSPSLRSERSGLQTVEKNAIRRLTPRECFRLMDFPDTFTWTCSDTQAYKQAGNSIVVRCLELIIKQFNL